MLVRDVDDAAGRLRAVDEQRRRGPRGGRARWRRRRRARPTASACSVLGASQDSSVTRTSATLAGRERARSRRSSHCVEVANTVCPISLRSATAKIGSSTRLVEADVASRPSSGSPCGDRRRPARRRVSNHASSISHAALVAVALAPRRRRGPGARSSARCTRARSRAARRSRASRRARAASRGRRSARPTPMSCVTKMIVLPACLEPLELRRSTSAGTRRRRRRAPRRPAARRRRPGRRPRTPSRTLMPDE